MRSKDDIKESVKAYILKEFLPGEDPTELTASTRLMSGGVLDSLATLRLVEFLERQFQIEIQAHEASIDYMDTIEAISNLVSSKA